MGTQNGSSNGNGSTAGTSLKKYFTRVAPGQSRYVVTHDLGTTEVIVQTRIAGRVRDGGVTITGPNKVELDFGGNLNEPLDVVVIG